MRSFNHFVKLWARLLLPAQIYMENPLRLQISGMPKAFEAVDLMIDGGECSYGAASTILDLSKERIEVLREGPITKDAILKRAKIVF